MTSDGDVVIGYAAKLRWGPLRFDYGARITTAKDVAPSQRQSLAFGQLEAGVETITWRNDRLGVEGTWSGGQPIGETVVVDEPAGTIAWRCLGANCAVDLLLDGRRLQGSGYVERLSMNIVPWRLPFDRLRWGRYISTDRRDHVVWIDLRGKTDRNWIWINSDRAPAGIVDDAGLRTREAELIFESSRPLRSENVARTLLGYFHFLRNALPRKIRGIQENKQLSTCRLVTENAESTGFSINEVVTWH